MVNHISLWNNMNGKGLVSLDQGEVEQPRMAQYQYYLILFDGLYYQRNMAAFKSCSRYCHHVGISYHPISIVIAIVVACGTSDADHVACGTRPAIVQRKELTQDIIRCVQQNNIYLARNYWW